MTSVTRERLVTLFNQARPGLLLYELKAIREGVIGSEPLIALINRGHPIEALSEALCDDARPHHDAYILTNEYLTAAATGDALLRARQDMPPVLAAPVDTLAAMRSTKPNWGPLWEIVQMEQEVDGLLADDPAWSDDFMPGQTWRARLEKVLNELNERFRE